ncbi:peptidyl-prolyl cis-trans isomerase E [Tanacetum coccineum]
MNQQVQKNTLYRGLAGRLNGTKINISAFIPFGDIKDVKTPLDQATQKHRSFGFVTFLEREDAAAAMDNMDGAELYGRVLTVNYALPEKIKGGEQGWAAQPSMFPTRHCEATNPRATTLLEINFLPVGFKPLTSALEGWYSYRWVTSCG